MLIGVSALILPISILFSLYCVVCEFTLHMGVYYHLLVFHAQYYTCLGNRYERDDSTSGSTPRVFLP